MAETYHSLGYLIPIISVLLLSFLPRGRFIQLLVLNVLSACVGAALSLLIMWSALQARIHTRHEPDPPQSPRNPYAAYNSSQAAVSGVWLFFSIWLLNCVRARFPPFNLPAIVFAIFVNVACVYSSFVSEMAVAKELIRELLEAVLTAMALSAGVSLLVVPISSRTVVFAEMQGYLGLLRGTVKAQGEYLHTLESADMFAGTEEAPEAGRAGLRRRLAGRQYKDVDVALTDEAKELRGSVNRLLELHGKLQADIVFTERDGIWGKLMAEDLQSIRDRLRDIMAPV